MGTIFAALRSWSAVDQQAPNRGSPQTPPQKMQVLESMNQKVADQFSRLRRLYPPV
jgi:hypothetical protein